MKALKFFVLFLCLTVTQISFAKSKGHVLLQIENPNEGYDQLQEVTLYSNGQMEVKSYQGKERKIKIPQVELKKISRRLESLDQFKVIFRTGGFCRMAVPPAYRHVKKYVKAINGLMTVEVNDHCTAAEGYSFELPQAREILWNVKRYLASLATAALKP